MVLERLACNCDLSWSVGGDFNCTVNEDEKEGGSKKTTSEIMSFQDSLNICALDNLGWNGGTVFTWSNKRFRGDLIKKGLDRFVASSD